ncbi:metal-dependent transcriptional regulator [Candidatus Woesearchaeota archaeon]|nr:metal-dependent transcriptional regulator [Candidatus Woesearchaeota archaeon]
MSINSEDYLVEIYRLSIKNSDVRTTDIASKLNVAKASASAMIKKLAIDGYLDSSKYSKINFTNKGYKLAKEIYDRHKLIEKFLKEILGRKDSKIHIEAHELEHVFSKLSILKIKKLLGE